MRKPEAMQETERLLDELKKALKTAGITYAELARHLNLSEASVKRLFHSQSFSLIRLEQACRFAGLEIADLVGRINASVERISELTPEQEKHLLGNPKLLLMIYLLLNQWSFDEIVATYTIDRAEGFGLLRQLERLRMIEVLPGDKVKLLTARNFKWRKNGPVQTFFREQVQSEFLASRFAAPDEDLRFVAARLSRTSLMRMQRHLDRTVREFDDLAKQDASLPSDEVTAAAAVLAIRPWQFSMFADMKREQ